mgnify:CR=1 FL=1|tara:strand:- start:28901 stop:29476 length:576 start_codon:yes stop_codon:yes gene_type:complete
MKTYTLITLFVLSMGMLHAQEKQEYEERIKKEEMPTQAISLVSPYLEEVRRLRYYHEVDGTSESFEIKFKKEGTHFSVEFSPEGVLEDVEVRWEFDSLSEAVQKLMETYLDKNTDRWRIEKIQRQYVAGTDPSKSLADAVALSEEINYNFECIITTKTNGKVTRYEMLFDTNGTWLNSRKILRRSYDFILF